MRVHVPGIWMDKMSMIVWSIPMVFSLFPISFIFFSSAHNITALQRGVDGSFIFEKEGQNRKVQKIRVKSLLNYKVGVRSPISL
jgi:hypothetical protein